MEHEYYTGLSILIMVYLATTKMGPGISKWLDKEVDVRIFIGVFICLISIMDELGWSGFTRLYSVDANTIQYQCQCAFNSAFSSIKSPTKRCY